MKPIIKRSYYEIKIETVSPVNIGNMYSELTDADVIKNSVGECFIPGTSIAGAFRNYIMDKKNKPSIYGYIPLNTTNTEGRDNEESSKDNPGRMSSVFISDLYFDIETVHTSVRDLVALNDDKTVNNKFDIEIVERGATATIQLEAVEREGDTFDYDGTIQNAVEALHLGEIRFGANKNRGFGRVKVISVAERKFTSNEWDDWLTFLENNKAMGEKDHKLYENSIEKATSERQQQEKEHIEKRYTRVSIPLRLKGGISIRKYSAKPGKADYSHITDGHKQNEVPVIPGTSWNGAIRSDASKILSELGCSQDEAKIIISRWFGSVKKGKDDESDPHQSMIVISESVLNDSKSVPMTRVQIDRFTGSTNGDALYSEEAYFGGTTILEYFVRKPTVKEDIEGKEWQDYRALLKMMELVVEDIKQGYLSIGGEAAIGRGIFELNNNEKAYHSELPDPSDLDKALIKCIEEAKQGNENK